jgi:hypothetical protein
MAGMCTYFAVLFSPPHTLYPPAVELYPKPLTGVTSATEKKEKQQGDLKTPIH